MPSAPNDDAFMHTKPFATFVCDEDYADGEANVVIINDPETKKPNPMSS
jgi:hypothetical protein